jgi:hypothetical protein
MSDIAVKLMITAARLRVKFKKSEYYANVYGHPVRMKMYHFIQTRLKRFVNWFYTKCSADTQARMDELYRGC